MWVLGQLQGATQFLNSCFKNIRLSVEFIQGWCQFQGMIFTDKMSGECPFYPHLNVIANVHGSVVPLRRGGISCFKWKSSR